MWDEGRDEVRSSMDVGGMERGETEGSEAIDGVL